MSVLIGNQRAYVEREARGQQIYSAGVQGPDVAPPGMIRRIIVVQQVPDHPRSQFWIGPPPVPASRGHRPALIVRQQTPDHPRSIFRSGTPPISYEDIQIFVIN